SDQTYDSVHDDRTDPKVLSGGGPSAPSSLFRRDDEAEPRLGTVVAREAVSDLLGGEALVCGPRAEHVVDLLPAIVERGETARPEAGVFQDLVEQVRHLPLGHGQ